MAADECKQFIDWLLQHCPRRRVRAAFFGAKLVWREVERYRKQGASMKSLPVCGFKKELIAHGQLGDIYRHLRFHIGCSLIPVIGPFIGYAAELIDKRQLSKGRKESEVELLDNAAARECAHILLKWIWNTSDTKATREALQMVLHE